MTGTEQVIDRRAVLQILAALGFGSATVAGRPGNAGRDRGRAARPVGDQRRLDRGDGRSCGLPRTASPSDARVVDPVVRERLDAARFYSATDYIKAQRVGTLLMQEMATVFRPVRRHVRSGADDLPAT